MTEESKFAEWRKSTLSSAGDNCVEVAFTADGRTGVRDSKQQGLGPVLVFTQADFSPALDATRLATALLHADLSSNLPPTGMIRGSSDVVLFGDFLERPEDVITRLQPLSRRGLRGHVVEVSDPAEESFPYAGRIEFSDPATGQKFLSGRSELLRDEYRQLYFARRDTLRDELRHQRGRSAHT